MPVKIEFQVVSSTGEDDDFRATELNYHGPTARGWRSSINCAFPQEIILQLKVFAILQQIQILAHQYLIPQKIEICTSSKFEEDKLCNNTRDLFEYLGFITFSDNKATGFRSRELKSILIPSKKARYIKLRIHNNHVNVKNIYNQVSLMAVNILGDEIQKTEDTELNNNSFHSAGTYTALSFNSNYLSPYDDLAFQMSVDEETARIIKIIEYKMLQAVFEERLEYANALKITIENLRAAGEILGVYEQEKRKAINLEDFDRAKSKKIQIDNFRRRIYSTLRIDRLLDQIDFIEEYDINSNAEEMSNESTPIRNSPRRDHFNGRTSTPNEIINENVPAVEYENRLERSPSRLLRPLKPSQLFRSQMTHSRSQTFPDSPASFQTSTFSASASNPQLYRYLKQPPTTIPEGQGEPEAGNLRTPSSESDSLTGDDESSCAKSPEKLKATVNVNSSLIPRLETKTKTEDGSVVPGRWKEPKSPPAEGWVARNKMRTSQSEQKIRHKTISTNAVKSSFEAYEDRMLPALRSFHGNEVVRECQLAFEQPRKSTLNEREKKQAMLPIAVFGIDLIEKFYSKSFNDKEEGLRQLQQELKRIENAVDAETDGTKTPSCNKVARAAVHLLHRALRDTVYSVYKLAAETVRLFFTEFVPQRVSPSEVARSVEKLFPELLTKSGDVTPRIHNMAAHTLLSMAECEEVRRLNIIPAHLSRPLTSSVHPRLALSRLEMVEQLILNHGISKDKKSGLTCRTLAEFGSSGLHHPAEAVRKVSERILLHVYKVNPRIVRKQLPPDDNVTRRNLLYRQLFQEFDVMDMQRKLSEQAIDDSMAFETNAQVLPIQRPEVQNKVVNQRDYSEVSNKMTSTNDKEKIYAEKPRTLIQEQSVIPEVFFKKPTPQRKPVEATIKFPSLTDSIRTNKARLCLQKTSPKANKPESVLRKGPTGNSSPGRPKEIKRETQNSGIPVPTFRTQKKIPASVKKPETEQKQAETRLKVGESKIPHKTMKVKTVEKAEVVGVDKRKGGGRQCFEKAVAKPEVEENVRFSDSMLASIRENEFTASGLFNGHAEMEGKPKICIFCLSMKKWTNEDSLNKHYLRDCLMLTTCEYCMEVTEISGFTNHLLDDCKWKHIFQKCTNCREAILRDLYDKHECMALEGKAHKSRCPFCHKNIGEGESSWRKHLMGENTCPNHPRQK